MTRVEWEALPRITKSSILKGSILAVGWTMDSRDISVDFCLITWTEEIRPRHPLGNPNRLYFGGVSEDVEYHFDVPDPDGTVFVRRGESGGWMNQSDIRQIA